MRNLATTTAILALSACAFVLGCTPDSLEGFEPNNTNTNNTTNNTTTNNTTNNNTGGTFTAEFVAVSGILAAECGAPGCHGSSAGNKFVLPTDTNATPAEMQQALDVNGASGMPMITPGNPAMSDIWDRLSRETSADGYMPVGGKVLDMAQYTAIETWITNGAVYTE